MSSRSERATAARVRASESSRLDLISARDSLDGATLVARAALDAREIAVVGLRRAGWTWDAIAELAGTTRQALMPRRQL